MNKFLSSDDLKYFGFPHIIKYSELANYNSIEELLPTDKSYVIILVEQKHNEGHWTCLLRYDNTIENFDSYGTRITHELSFITANMRRLLGESPSLLDRLLDKAKKDKWKVVYNKKRWQSQNANVNTCGRWVVLRIQLMLMGYTLKQFNNFIERWSEKTHLHPDQLSVRWVRLLNEN